MNITTYKQFQNFFVIWGQGRVGGANQGGNNEKEGGKYQKNGTNGYIEVLRGTEENWKAHREQSIILKIIAYGVGNHFYQNLTNFRDFWASNFL